MPRVRRINDTAVPDAAALANPDSGDLRRRYPQRVLLFEPAKRGRGSDSQDRDVFSADPANEQAADHSPWPLVLKRQQAHDLFPALLRIVGRCVIDGGSSVGWPFSHAVAPLIHLVTVDSLGWRPETLADRLALARDLLPSAPGACADATASSQAALAQIGLDAYQACLASEQPVEPAVLERVLDIVIAVWRLCSSAVCDDKLRTAVLQCLGDSLPGIAALAAGLGDQGASTKHVRSVMPPSALSIAVHRHCAAVDGDGADVGLVGADAVPYAAVRPGNQLATTQFATADRREPSQDDDVDDRFGRACPTRPGQRRLVLGRGGLRAGRCAACDRQQAQAHDDE